MKCEKFLKQLSQTANYYNSTNTNNSANTIIK